MNTTITTEHTTPLTGPILEGLDPDLWALWNQRLPWDFDASGYTWGDVIASVKQAAQEAAKLDGLTPAQIIERQIAAVRQGIVDGSISQDWDRPGIPFCGCLIGIAAREVGHHVGTYLSRDPLFAMLRDGRGLAPVEILAYLLEPGEQDTPQAALVIRALEQAQATLP